MDPLSDVLSLLKPRSYKSGGFDVGPLSIGFPRHEGIKCYAMVSGSAWLAFDDGSDPVALQSGDCFLLPSGRPFRLATDLALESIDAMTLFEARRNGDVQTFNGGGDCCILGGHFLLSGSQAGLLLDALPPIVHLRKESDKAALRWSLDRMRQELYEKQPGSFLIAQHLAHMMLVQALRLYLTDAEQSSANAGWLFALADPQMGAAIGAIHREPARHWTLELLAKDVGMSRSSFAQKFKTMVGASPMEYLTHWRMMLAGDRLAYSSDPVSTVALSLGYASESAFSTAFKRVMNCSPRQYGKRQKATLMK